MTKCDGRRSVARSEAGGVPRFRSRAGGTIASLAQRPRRRIRILIDRPTAASHRPVSLGDSAVGSGHCRVNCTSRARILRRRMCRARRYEGSYRCLVLDMAMTRRRKYMGSQGQCPNDEKDCVSTRLVCSSVDFLHFPRGARATFGGGNTRQHKERFGSPRYET